MKTLISLLTVLFLFTNAGYAQWVDPALSASFERFKADALNDTCDLSKLAKFDSIILVSSDFTIYGDDNNIGGGNGKVIYIKTPKKWKGIMEDFEHELILYHVLGKQVLGLVDYQKDFSIMNRVQEQGPAYYYSQWDDLKKQYFYYYHHFYTMRPYVF